MTKNRAIQLSIYHYPKMNRQYLLKREHGDYDQHAHFFTKKEAVQCRKLIDAMVYPRQKKFLIAMKRILTEEEFKMLNKKPRYYNVNKGVRY